MSNVFSFTGTVGQNATVNVMPNGNSVLSVSVANNIGFGDKQKTMWVRVQMWGRRAEGSLASYLVKGQQVFVSGEMSLNEYKANDGTTKTRVEVNATILDLVGRKNDNHQPAPTQNYAPPSPQNGYVPPHEQHRRDVANHNQQHAYPSPNGDTPYDDDIPF